jgi:hypothetical protein
MLADRTAMGFNNVDGISLEASTEEAKDAVINAL